MQPLLFFKEQTLLSLQLIFSQIPILFLSITMKNIFITSGSLGCSEKNVFLTLVLILFLSFTYFLEITISAPVFFFRLTETQVGVENLFQECLQAGSELFFQQ